MAPTADTPTPEENQVDTVDLHHVPEYIRFCLRSEYETEKFSKIESHWVNYDLRGENMDYWLIRQCGQIVIAHLTDCRQRNVMLYCPGSEPIRLDYLTAVRWAYDFINGNVKGWY